jgi:hypothetical protein
MQTSPHTPRNLGIWGKPLLTPVEIGNAIGSVKGREERAADD